MTNVQLAVQFFLQIAVILTACRVVGAVARRFGQPQVVAEMITGVLLGPSLLGWLWPDVQAALFPWDPAQASRDTQSYLFPASQLGLALYMFVVGLEFRADVIKTNLRSSVAVSLAGMLTPFALGGGLAAVLHAHTALFPERTTLPEAMLFLGSSMSITAFPMLARIIHHKGLAGTRMGTIAIGAGAIDDAAAWALLALVLASFEGEPAAALVNLGAAAAYVLVMVFVVGPLLRRCEPRLLRREPLLPGGGELHETGFVLALTLMALGAFTTDAIGLHAVFGAFVAGAVVPRGVAQQVVARIEPLAVALLLPLFFTYSGLNTRIGLLDSASLWFWCGAVLVAAIAGKGIACWLAARLTGVPNRQALGIGVLMNARGLMELIVVNIGLQRGVISPALFAILVVMAVITTLMASPIFDRLVGSARD
jgi:Kef-type K+ transport system membrane component KefB